MALVSFLAGSPLYRPVSAQRVIAGDVKAFALIVDAKDEKAVAFYQRHGFQAFASRPHSLFLPLGTVKKGAAT